MNGDWQSMIGISEAEYGRLKAVEEYAERCRAALESANDICRSAYAIAHRIATDHGAVVLETNFDAFKWRCKESLAIQHRVLYPEQYTDERVVRAHQSPATASPRGEALTGPRSSTFEDALLEDCDRLRQKIWKMGEALKHQRTALMIVRDRQGGTARVEDINQGIAQIDAALSYIPPEVAPRVENSPDVVTPARELLFLYDWRFKLAEEEGKVMEHKAPSSELKAKLREYGERKKAGWIALRAALAALDRYTPNEVVSPEERR